MGTYEHDPVAVGERIRDARRELGLTQRTLAKEAGIRIGILDSLEAGLRDPEPYLESLAAATGRDPDWFLGVEPPEEAPPPRGVLKRLRRDRAERPRSVAARREAASVRDLERETGGGRAREKSRGRAREQEETFDEERIEEPGWEVPAPEADARAARAQEAAEIEQRASAAVAREQVLAEREQVLATREDEVERRAAEVEARMAELHERASQLEERESALERREAVVAAELAEMAKTELREAERHARALQADADEARKYAEAVLDRHETRAERLAEALSRLGRDGMEPAPAAPRREDSGRDRRRWRR